MVKPYDYLCNESGVKKLDRRPLTGTLPGKCTCTATGTRQFKNRTFFKCNTLAAAKIPTSKFSSSRFSKSTYLHESPSANAGPENAELFKNRMPLPLTRNESFRIN